MFRVTCEWGPNRVKKLSELCQVTVIVDVLSFSTSVDIAVGRSMRVYPYGGPLEEAPEFARRHDAELAQHRGKGRFSLSPASFASGPHTDRIVLPSPNGATLTLLAAQRYLVLCGCLMNAAAVAAACEGYASVGVAPAGERWPDGSLRPALEDWLGAGAIISHLSGTCSPEARAAAAAFEAHQDALLEALWACPSGLELINKGYGEDVEIAGRTNASRTVPQFEPPAYQQRPA